MNDQYIIDYFEETCDNCGHPIWLHHELKKGLLWSKIIDSNCKSTNCNCNHFKPLSIGTLIFYIKKMTFKQIHNREPNEEEVRLLRW